MGNKVVGDRIASRRKQLGLTLDDIAQEIGVAKSTIQRYERGTIETIKLPVIEAIADLMAVNPAWLCGKTDDPTVPRQTNDDIVKFALFGDVDVDDAVYEEVKRFAKFAQEQARGKS